MSHREELVLTPSYIYLVKIESIIEEQDPDMKTLKKDLKKVMKHLEWLYVDSPALDVSLEEDGATIEFFCCVRSDQPLAALHMGNKYLRDACAAAHINMYPYPKNPESFTLIPIALSVELS